MDGVKIFKRIDGDPIELVIAMTAEAQAGTARAAHDRATVANTVLNLAKHRTGDSKIVVDRLFGEAYGNIDWFVILDDTGGEDASWQIEFGTSKTTKPLAPLRRSFGLMEGY